MAVETVTPCSGPGIAVADGKIEVYGARRRPWSSGSMAGCSLEQYSGLYYDPDSNKVYTPPDPDVSWTQFQPDPKSVSPGTKANTLMGEFSLSLKARACTRSYVHTSLADGFASGFLVSGDWWVIRRMVWVSLDGASTHQSDETAWFMAPSTGAWLGAPLADFQLSRDLDPGTTFKMKVQWWLDILAAAPGANDTITVRFPNHHITCWSYP